MSDEIRPALTPEQWALVDDGRLDIEEWSWVGAPKGIPIIDKLGMAAALLDGHFQWSQVRLLRVLLNSDAVLMMDADEIQELREIADSIEELLPPEPVYEPERWEPCAAPFEITGGWEANWASWESSTGLRYRLIAVKRDHGVVGHHGDAFMTMQTFTDEIIQDPKAAKLVQSILDGELAAERGKAGMS